MRYPRKVNYLTVALVCSSGHFQKSKPVSLVDTASLEDFWIAACAVLDIDVDPRRTDWRPNDDNMLPTQLPLRWRIVPSIPRANRDFFDAFILPSNVDIIIDLSLDEFRRDLDQTIITSRELLGFMHANKAYYDEISLRPRPSVRTCHKSCFEEPESFSTAQSMEMKWRDSVSEAVPGHEFHLPDGPAQQNFNDQRWASMKRCLDHTVTNIFSSIKSTSSGASYITASSSSRYSYMTAPESSSSRIQRRRPAATQKAAREWLSSRQCAPHTFIGPKELNFCKELWSLRAISSWLQHVASKQAEKSQSPREILVTALAYLLISKVQMEPFEALGIGNQLVTSLENSTPPVLTWYSSRISWSPDNASGVFPELTPDGCYSPSLHKPILHQKYQSCYVPSCNFVRKVQIRPMSEAWFKLLESTQLLPDPDEELDWSGRGQHAEFNRLAEVPLEPKQNLGFGAFAAVQSVICKRIRLACKTIRCRTLLMRQYAIEEFKNLQIAQHAHVVRVVGTYVLTTKRDLSILMYPVTDHDLETFLENILDRPPGSAPQHMDQVSSLTSFFSCLSSTLAFLQSKNIKHMDIKPKNILVRTMDQRKTSHPYAYKVYLTDFGISRAYGSIEESETCSVTAFTRLYAAPEVVAQEVRGFKADVFSLGCVFAEMLAVLHEKSNEPLDLSQGSSYQENISTVQGYLKKCAAAVPLSPRYGGYERSWFEAAVVMIHKDPKDRPSASQVCKRVIGPRVACCDAGPEPFEAAT